MTTAHRPTWAPAKGNEETGGARFFGGSARRMAKDVRGQTVLKYRQDGQASATELGQRDLKLELQEKELQAARSRDGLAPQPGRALLLAPPGALAPPPLLVPKAVDADDSDEAQSGSDDSDDDDDEDDTAALLAELEKIKAGRAEEAARRETSRAAAEFAERSAELAGGNPLLHLQGGEADFGLKRAWHDDSVFKHQSRNEPVAKKRFINDTIRSDFHRRFLQRYIR